MFLPYVYKFNAPVTNDIIQSLNEDPHGFVRFSFRGFQYEGYIEEVETVDYPKDGTWTVIAKEISTGDNKVFENGDNHILNKGNIAVTMGSPGTYNAEAIANSYGNDLTDWVDGDAYARTTAETRGKAVGISTGTGDNIISTFG